MGTIASNSSTVISSLASSICLDPGLLALERTGDQLDHVALADPGHQWLRGEEVVYLGEGRLALDQAVGARTPRTDSRIWSVFIPSINM